MNADVTVLIPTKGRYHSTLLLTLLSIVNQTVSPKHIILFDDGEKKDLREDPLYQYVFQAITRKSIGWEVAFGEGRGQVVGHQQSIEKAKTEWIWRIDDDCVAEPDVLEKLLSAANEKTGAVGGCVIDPKQVPFSTLASNKIEDIYLGLNEQWFQPAGNGLRFPDHLYSTFIYRKAAASHGYCKDLSPAGHREETIFTHEMKRNGWDLIFNPRAVTLHFRNPEGGIRTHKDPSMWGHDEQIFARKLREWKVEPINYKVIALNSGLGDHLVFAKVLPDIRKKYPNLILGCCYNEVFEDEKDLKLISIAEASMMCNMDDQSVYKYLWDHTSEVMDLETAYRRMYL